jgi:hypothetical protein
MNSNRDHDGAEKGACPVEAPGPAHPGDGYVAPRIEDDLEVEVMSLACTGFRPKQASPTPCRTLGS